MEAFVTTIIKKVLAQEYPHTALPSIVYASVASVSDRGTYYEYTLTVLDRFGEADGDYPPLPGVRARESYEAGTAVLVAFPYGEISPQIIGEVIL